jgi:hypothetical protein
VTGPPRDWDKEMAEIDKIIAKQPAVPQGSAVKASGSAPVQRAAVEAAPVVRTRRTALATWVQVLLGVIVAAGVTLAWPYAHSCGLSLYGYLAAAAGVVLVGLWGAVASWARRMALAHLIALVVTLSGALLVGKTFLDRSSYPRRPSTWSCTAP